jgi:hypothetical protein
MGKNKINRRLLAYSDYCSISHFRTKILAMFQGIFRFFVVFQNGYVFIALFPAEPLTLFCGRLSEKRKFKSYAELDIFSCVDGFYQVPS